MLYRSIDGDRLEHARLRVSDAGGVGEGTIVGLFGGRPLRVRHELTCDSRWHARNVSVEVLAPERELVSLSADEDGIWRRVGGAVLDVPIFNCFDVSIGLTPLPVALTLRRIRLEPREAVIINVAQIELPALTVRLIEQRYTCLAIDAQRRSYRLENFDSGERSVIQLDAQGVVSAQDGMFERIWPVTPAEALGG